ncbi:MAG TPA: hemolysin III family protein [Actinomycetaceae bacterium]|nr:hemolysin III family protein [Actinomycetaceae bacterium]
MSAQARPSPPAVPGEFPRKPRLRGWLHTGMTPVAVVAGIVLIAMARPGSERVAAAVFAASSVLLFGCSAVYHRGTWRPRTLAILRRLDHANIFILIAGTYTPLAVALLPPARAAILLGIVWAGAGVGIVLRLVWLSAPRWLYVPLYIALGWVAVGYLPTFWGLGHHGVTWLVAAGGAAYTLGAIVYGTRWPNPRPRTFGFHEIFHAATLVGFACHYGAAVLALRGG